MEWEAEEETTTNVTLSILDLLKLSDPAHKKGTVKALYIVLIFDTMDKIHESMFCRAFVIGPKLNFPKKLLFSLEELQNKVTCLLVYLL